MSLTRQIAIESSSIVRIKATSQREVIIQAKMRAKNEAKAVAPNKILQLTERPAALSFVLLEVLLEGAVVVLFPLEEEEELTAVLLVEVGFNVAVVVELLIVLAAGVGFVDDVELIGELVTFGDVVSDDVKGKLDQE